MKTCLLTYRGNPYCGGQGIYVSCLARELARQGHEVHGISGPPYPEDIPGVIWHRVAGVRPYGNNGTYPPHEHPLSAFAPVNFYEWAASLTGVFPEMTALSVRALVKMRHPLSWHHFSIIPDNPPLGWCLRARQALVVPLVGIGRQSGGGGW